METPGDKSPLPLSPELRNAIVSGLVLGVVAACVVWWLERFESRRMIGEVETYLRRHADFQGYLRERGESVDS